jgi:geranylgeranyl diphosphate synthase, type II
MMNSHTSGLHVFNLSEYLEHKKAFVEKGLYCILERFPQDSRITDAVAYCLMSGGKRLRPILCVASAEVVCANDSCADNVLWVACALEMIHTYSLIHDDLPAMDNDELRRGKPTCHVAFDEATAILSGDALLTMAFETLSLASNMQGENPGRWLRVIELIARASGVHGMVEGQMRDISSEGNILSLESLKKMYLLKTGALIEASVCSGAILSGAHDHQLDHLKTYAQNIGLAFQVVDDILNIEGDPDLLGKAVGTDEQRNKNTYPSLLGLPESKIFVEKLVKMALQALDVFDNRSDPLRAIARYIIDRKK